MALWDLAGKAYNVPAYQMLGGKFRDKVRLYCDTTESHDPKVYGERLKKRVEERASRSSRWISATTSSRRLPAASPNRSDSPGVRSRRPSICSPASNSLRKASVSWPITSAKSRQVIGMEIPLAADHFGHIGVNSCIRLGKALEKHNMAWLEDMVPWQYPELWKQITDAVDIPTLTGEDIYLKEDFFKLCRMNAVDIVHPDLATSGGLLETKKIGDGCQELGHAMAMHFAGTPISFFANVHCAAATENFLALEFHSNEVPWWEDMVGGIDKPIIDKGFVKVPERPGLGVEPSEEVIKQHLMPGTQYFPPSTDWDKDRPHDRLWS